MTSVTPQFGVSIKYALSADRGAVRDLAQAAEALGYDSVWVSEHIAIPVGYASRYPFSTDGQPPFPDDTVWGHATVTLAFVAAVTERVRLATSVIPMLSRDPVSLAKEAATLDALSGGRLELGLGAGWLREEADVLGHPSDHPAARLEEAIEIMRKAWSPGSFSHYGRFWQLPETQVNPKPVQGRGLPIWIGGVGTIALRTTVEQAIGNIVMGGPDQASSVCGQLRAHRPDLRICVATDLDDETLVSRATALREAGADVLVLRTAGEPIPETVRANIALLEWFAREIRPGLEQVVPESVPLPAPG